jgi:hypothetical protein
MLGFLKERPGVFGPDEVHTLVAASIRHGRPLKPAGSSTRRLKPKLRGRSSQNISAAALDGERDYARLRDGALLALAQSNLRSTPHPPG